MKKWCSWLCLMMLFSGVAQADTVKRDQTWRLCHRDSDCVIAEDMCPGTYWAIHRKFRYRNAIVNERIRPILKCTASTLPPPTEAVCPAGVCLGR